MSMQDGGIDWVAGLILFIGFAVGVAVGVGGHGEAWEKDAIEHGAAHYNGKTGEFQWNETEVDD